MIGKRKFLIWPIFLSLSLLGLASIQAAVSEETGTVEEVSTATAAQLTTTDQWAALREAATKRQAEVTLWNETVWNNTVKANEEKAAAAAKAQATKKIPKVSSSSSSGISPSGGSHRGYPTARSCVENVENGGSYDRSSNPTHFGRYQFARQSWASFGGDPNTWGIASPAEQDEVFNNAWSQGPAVQTQQWLRWDGCGPPDGS